MLEAELERAARHNADLKEEVELKGEGEKNRGLWLKNYNEQIASKEERIEPNSSLRDRNP